MRIFTLVLQVLVFLLQKALTFKITSGCEKMDIYISLQEVRGKTRSIVSPNLLQATGSYVVTDPKGNLYTKYGEYLKEKGYEFVKISELIYRDNYKMGADGAQILNT